MSKSLREAAEAVIAHLGMRFMPTYLLHDLRDAMSEPDPMAKLAADGVRLSGRLMDEKAEALKIIAELVSVIQSAELYSPTADDARDFLARMKGGGE